MKEYGDLVRAWEAHRGEALAMATLVAARGSSYRRPGARMLIAGQGSLAGSLSGGCLEEEVVDRARRVLRDGAPAWMEFDTRRRFGCHGALEILIERVGDCFLDALASHFWTRRTARLITCFSRRERDVGTRFGDEWAVTAEGRLVQVLHPILRLLIIGEGPDSAPLQAMAGALGWECVQLENAAELPPAGDDWTAAIVKTHNYGRDFAALRALLPLRLRYAGVLGPRRRRDQLVGDLLDTGTLGDFGSLFGPAGLALGGDSPEVTALSIVAEIQTVFFGGAGGSLRDSRMPIHLPEFAASAGAC